MVSLGLASHAMKVRLVLGVNAFLATPGA
jgi:hypothetical protein